MRAKSWNQYGKEVRHAINTSGYGKRNFMECNKRY